VEKIIRTDRVRNEESLLRVKKERNILHKINSGKANWIGHICAGTACLLKQGFEGKGQGGIEVTGRRGSERKYE
jgi:hypothetical protein